jgi:hypothetical protein
MIDPTYDASFFSFCTRWAEDYYHVADWLCAFLDFDSALDLGCGNAYIVSGLRRAGRKAFGCEVARDAALPFMPTDVREYVTQHDFLRGGGLQTVDLIVCTEVAEHLTQREGSRLVRNIAAIAQKWAFFTAATPGQGGHHHVNEQPNEYWIRKFQRRGMRLDDIKTHLARRILGETLKDAKFLAKNAMVFKA